MWIQPRGNYFKDYPTAKTAKYLFLWAASLVSTFRVGIGLWLKCFVGSPAFEASAALTLLLGELSVTLYSGHTFHHGQLCVRPGSGGSR